MADTRTLLAYQQFAEDYAERFSSPGLDPGLEAFIDALPAGAHVLDLGCGPGAAAAKMVSAGLVVDALDASPEMAALAWKNYALRVKVAGFESLEAVACYDGIWANFSLLHAPKPDFSRYLSAVHRALKPDGLLHLGMKLGEGEIRDRFGRFYAYYSQDQLIAALQDTGFRIVAERILRDTGLDGTAFEGIVITARANGSTSGP